MDAILYGNLRAEIVGDAGVRIQRVTLRQATLDLLRPGQPGAPQRPWLLGREREAAAALAAIQDGRPAGFHGACGYGKTTLLADIAATAAHFWPSSIYLRADRNRIGDLLQQLVARLYVCDEPVKLTPQECARLLGQASAVIAVDDLRAGPEQVGYLLDLLPGCRLVIGSDEPVLGGRGSSHRLGGLPEEAALELIAGDLGRPLTGEEHTAARHLVAAVQGQPLHLRQCAALARDGGHSLPSLARQAAHDPEVLDRLSISALARGERRALAVLALAAGALLPVTVVETIGQLAYLGEWLESLHRRGLAERRDDRFGLPVCKAESYRQLLLRDLDLAASARDLSRWLTVASPTAPESLSAAEAALAIMDFAAERGDWAIVARLASAADRALFLAGRWEAWHHALGQGLAAARASGDQAAAAFFAHQQGTLAFCRDRLNEAQRLLRQALTLREQIGDDAGAGVTRHNLRLLEPPDPPRPPRRRVPRRALTALGGALTTLALAAAAVAITGALRSGRTDGGPPDGPPSSPVAAAPGQPTGSGPGQPAGSGQGPASGPGQPALGFTPTALAVATVGTVVTRQIVASGGTPPYTFSWSGNPPSGLELSTDGTISGIPDTVGRYRFTITATDSSASTRRGSRRYTLRVAPVPVTISLSPATLGAETVGAAVSQQIIASGGTAPYTFSMSGNLPSGLNLSPSGLISGTPATAGSYQFTVKATDSAGHSGSQSYTLQVGQAAVTITLSPAALPAPDGCAYRAQLTASGGTTPYTFSWSGVVPAGLTLSSSGFIHGILQNTTTYQFTITATDSTGHSGWHSYTLTEDCPSSATTGSATTGSATTGSATTGSATTGSATTGSATTVPPPG
jgi:Putative Ig domain